MNILNSIVYYATVKNVIAVCADIGRSANN